VRDLALLASRHTNAIADAEALAPEAVLDLLNAADAWRRPERFTDLVHAALAGEPERGRAIRRLERAREAGAAIDAGAIAQAGAKKDIKERVNAARLDAIRKALKA
jgi:tRNA nucleotidyltransferase (CCA-adding enzyme)